MIVESMEVRSQDGTPQGQRILLVNGQGMQLAQSQTVTATGNPGVVGQVAWDTNNLYLCVAPNTWKRVALVAIP